MSRVGKNPVEVPGGVEVRIDPGVLVAKGKLGEQTVPLTDEVTVTHEDGKVTVKPAGEHKRARMMWGTTRALVQNALTGVSEGFSYDLEINGVGYRAQVQGNTVKLQLGYSHDIDYPLPEGITAAVERNVLTLKGGDKQRLGQVAAEIRGYRPPEPYKGKGVKYASERIIRKEGKKK